MSTPVPEAEALLQAIQAVRKGIPDYAPDHQVAGPDMHNIMRHLDRRLALNGLERDLNHFIENWKFYDMEGIP